MKSNLMRVYELQQPNGLDSWSLAERPIPKPERDQVLVKIRAVSLNYRDILIATGRYGSAPLPAALIPLSDGAGEVVEVGSDVSRFTTGARVAGIFSQSWLGGSQVDDAWNTALGGAVHGVLAEYQVFDQNGLVRIPNHLSYEEGSTLPCAGVTAFVTQTLFNPNYLHLNLGLLKPAYIPALGIGGWWTVYVLSLHTVWSISVSVALMDALVPERATTSWLGNLGLGVTAVLFALGAAAATRMEIEQDHYIATVGKFVGAAVAAVVLTMVAFLLPQNAPTPGRDSRIAFVGPSEFLKASC